MVIVHGGFYRKNPWCFSIIPRNPSQPLFQEPVPMVTFVCKVKMNRHSCLGPEYEPDR